MTTVILLALPTFLQSPRMVNTSSPDPSSHVAKGVASRQSDICWECAVEIFGQRLLTYRDLSTSYRMLLATENTAPPSSYIGKFHSFKCPWTPLLFSTCWAIGQHHRPNNLHRKPNVGMWEVTAKIVIYWTELCFKCLTSYTLWPVTCFLGFGKVEYV